MAHQEQASKDGQHVPGREEPYIASTAYPDPNWEKKPPPRTYENSRKTPTGEAIATKVRDIGPRRAFTGSTKMPRLTQKTNPKASGAEEEADCEEELKAYKKGTFSAPGWVRKAIKDGHHMSQIKPERLVKVGVNRNFDY